MESLPEELKVEIFQRLAKYGFRFLGPFISGSKATNEAIFLPLMLKSVDLAELIIYHSMLNKDSPYRSFFLHCIVAGNTTAYELEGLRILYQEGPSETAFRMVRYGGPHTLFGIFVSGVFRICSGEYETGKATLQEIWNHVYDFEDVVDVGDTVINQIVTMGAANASLYDATSHYPIEHASHCPYMHLEGENVCEVCYGFWYSIVVYTLC